MHPPSVARKKETLFKEVYAQLLRPSLDQSWRKNKSSCHATLVGHGRDMEYDVEQTGTWTAGGHNFLYKVF